MISFWAIVFHFIIEVEYWLCFRHDYASRIRALLISPSPYVRTYRFSFKFSGINGYFEGCTLIKRMIIISIFLDSILA